MPIPTSAAGNFPGSYFSLQQSAKVSSSCGPTSDAPCEGNSADASSVCDDISHSSCALPPFASAASLTASSNTPLRALSFLEGIDPNGPDANVGSPVKQQRLH